MKTLFVGLRVTDLDSSLAFYAALGYVELGRVAFDDGSRLVLLRFLDEQMATLELVHRPADGGVDVGTGHDHPAIQVDDLEATLERLTAFDCEPVQRPAGPDGPRTSFVSDPDGYRIELVQWPPGHPDGITTADFS